MFKEKIKKGYTIKVTTKEQVDTLCRWLEENMDQEWLEDIEDVQYYLESNDNLVYICPQEDDYNNTHIYILSELISYEEALLDDNEMPELKPGMILKVNWDWSGLSHYLYVTPKCSYNITEGLYSNSITKGDNKEIVAIYEQPESPFNKIIDNLGEPIWELKEKSEKDLKIEELEKTINTASETIKKASKQIEELKGE